jgi:hypothetical protein
LDEIIHLEDGEQDREEDDDDHDAHPEDHDRLEEGRQA